MRFRNGEFGGVPLVAPANLLTGQVLRREMLAPEVVTRSLVLPDTEQAPRFINLVSSSPWLMVWSPLEERVHVQCNSLPLNPDYECQTHSDTKQREKVEPALSQEKEDKTYIEGYPTLQEGFAGILVLAYQITNVGLISAKRG